jgi:hypothetical protein
VKSDVEIVTRSYILAFMSLLSVTYIQGWLQCMLQCYKCAQSYSLASWITGNFPSYFMHQEYFLIKRWNIQWKESCTGNILVVLWQNFLSYVENHVYVIWHTMCISRAAKPDFQSPLWYDNRMKSNIFNQSLKILVLLGIIHYHLALMFTSLEEFVRRQAVKWSASCHGRHSNTLTCV